MHVASSSRPRLPQSAEKALLRRPFSHLQRTDKPRPPHPTSHHNYKTVYQPARDFATACWGNWMTAPPATRQLERSPVIETRDLAVERDHASRRFAARARPTPYRRSNRLTPG